MKIIDSIEVDLNDSQGDIQIINSNTTICLWPRAGGKTSGGIAPRIMRLDKMMPRSQILIVSDTYERLETRIIPNIINFFIEKMGLIEGQDFIKYKKPPDAWTKPYIPLDRFEKVISFPSGMALCLVSLAVEGSGNAFNAQAAIFDETKFLKESDINTEVIPALRGAEDKYGHLPEYLSKWFFTDKYGGNIKWLLEKRKLVNQDAVDIVRCIQMEIFKLQTQKASTTSIASDYRYDQQIKPLEEKINRIRKHLIYVSDMKPYENKKVVGEFYFKSQKRTCKPHEFDIAILNKDPDQVEKCFYPSFTAKNKHHNNNDYNTNAPLIGAMDYNFAISPLPVAQYGMLSGNAFETVNIIDYIYEEYPLGIEDTINTLCKKYMSHGNKTFHFIFDHTAIGRSSLKTTFKDTVVDSFISNGWDVIEHFIGDAPDHDIKYEALKKIFDKVSQDSVVMNELRCDQLIKSVEQSPAIIVNGVTKKDKRTEKDPNFPARDSTHGSDAMDQLLWGLYEWGIKDNMNDTGLDIKAR